MTAELAEHRFRSFDSASGIGVGYKHDVDVRDVVEFGTAEFPHRYNAEVGGRIDVSQRDLETRVGKCR